MSDQQQAAVKPKGFFREFVLPSLLIFLIPICSYFFFKHVRDDTNKVLQAELIRSVESDEELTAEQKQQYREFYIRVPPHVLLDHEETAKDFPPQLVYDYWMWKWSIRLSEWSLYSGGGALLIVALSVIVSLRSQVVQYWSLLFGWHILRLIGAFQVIVQGILLVSLSFWVTAYLSSSYYPKLIGIAGLLAVIAICVLLAAIFKRPDMSFRVQGELIPRDRTVPIWQKLIELCDVMGTDPPDQIIAGIDDNFFVTEHDVILVDCVPEERDGQPFYQEHTVSGRSLYVSLSLLKQLDGQEAEAVMAHEMAHLSGEDTLYAKKINPLIRRFNQYLQALQEGGVTLPIYYFMLCFRALFELSLNKLSRQREIRADLLSAEITSPQASAGALLRIGAYSNFRNKVEQSFFDQEEAQEKVEIISKVEEGFSEYAPKFLIDVDLDQMTTTHPFDTHPCLGHRFESLEIELSPEQCATLVAHPGDGSWYHAIPNAADHEKKQWDAYEQQFVRAHEQSLSYRYIPDPENAVQIALVTKFFPGVQFESKEGQLTIDYEKLTYEPWETPIYYRDIQLLNYDSESSLLRMESQTPEASKKLKTNLKFGKFDRKDRDIILVQINDYYVRAKTAIEYQKQKAAEQETSQNTD